jgi:hypothetical protein
MSEKYSKIVVGQSHYLAGKKYCRIYECYFITNNIFCQCCGMQLRATPTERELKEKLNRKKKESFLLMPHLMRGEMCLPITY